MKKVVFKTDEIPHLWAHQKVTEARNRQGNLYFQGDTIFSYGSHFPIARIVKRNGQTAVLFTMRDYSQMTAQHKYNVRDACRHMTVFDVPKVSASHSEVKAAFKELCDERLTYARKANRGNGMFYRLNEVTGLVKQANAYAKFFGLKWEFKHPADWSKLRQRAQMLLKRHDARNAERNRLRLERQKLEDELRHKKFEELLPLWEKGQCSTNLLPFNEAIYLRATHGGRRIETSRGACVILPFAQAVWELVKTARTLNEAVTDISLEKVGETARSYPIDRIDADGSVHAGCHHIRWEQIKRLAKRLKWTHDDDPETTTAATAA